VPRITDESDHKTIDPVVAALADAILIPPFPGTKIRVRDLPRFAAAIAAGSLAVMPGHLRVPELTGSLPASLSPAAVTGMLRGELGFTGAVICDGLA
jgi:beta-glucosidase-like glycosyl hydrolase